MIMSPVQIKTEDQVVSGILIEKQDAINIISLINRTNADGLKGADALVLMQLQDAVGDLSKTTEECAKGE